jgi:hypothetical protein
VGKGWGKFYCGATRFHAPRARYCEQRSHVETRATCRCLCSPLTVASLLPVHCVCCQRSVRRGKESVFVWPRIRLGLPAALIALAIALLQGTRNGIIVIILIIKRNSREPTALDTHKNVSCKQMKKKSICLGYCCTHVMKRILVKAK